MPLLAFNRKDTGWRIDWQKARRPPIWPASPENACSVAVSWPLPVPEPPNRCSGIVLTRFPGLTQWLHRLVIGSAAALRRNPGNITVRVLHVAGFAMDAVLSVDLEARTGGLLDPFVNPRRAIAVGRPGVDVVLGGLLQVHVGDLQMNRLVLFVIGVGHEHGRQLVEGQLAVRLWCRDRRVRFCRVQRLSIRLVDMAQDIDKRIRRSLILMAYLKSAEGKFVYNEIANALKAKPPISEPD